MNLITNGENPPPNPRTPLLDIHTIKTIQSVTTYFFEKTTLYPVIPIPIESLSAYFYGQALPFPIAGNLLLRFVSCIEAYRERSYWKIACDVTSLASLIWIGPHATIVVDCASEAANLYFNSKDNGFFERLNRGKYFEGFGGKKDELDCTVRTNALMVLGLTEAEAVNSTVLDKRYEELCIKWDDRIRGAAAAKSAPFVDKFTLLLRRTERAYQTLKNN